MDEQWEKLASSIKPGLSIINSVDDQKYQLVLNRICSEFLKNPDSVEPFTETEKEKLVDSLSLERTQLDLLLTSSILIFNQIIYEIIKPSLLNSVLIKVLKLSEMKASSFVTTWNTNAKALVNKFKHKSIYNNQLDSISWLVNIETANDSKNELFEPKALLQLKMKGGCSESSLSLEFNEQQLYNFYNVLENVQQQLDSLNQS